MIGGYLLVAVMPKRMADSVFERLANSQRAKFLARLERDPIVERMKSLLSGACPDAGIRECAEEYQQFRTEDLWGRWQASYRQDWAVRTEVVGVEHVTNAQDQGRGVVFWGMSFCGTLFPKIALQNAGVALTQLSSADHGAWYPLTLLGKWVAGPLHCLPEGRYLAERIRMPVDGSSKYLFRVGKVLKGKGAVWIAGERTRAKKLQVAELLGREARFPVGAPLLARRYNAALLPVHTERLGRFHYRVVIEAPVELDNDLDRDVMVKQAVENYTDRLAARLRKKPGDWDWNHLWVKALAEDSS